MWQRTARTSVYLTWRPALTTIAERRKNHLMWTLITRLRSTPQARADGDPGPWTFLFDHMSTTDPPTYNAAATLWVESTTRSAAGTSVHADQVFRVASVSIKRSPPSALPLTRSRRKCWLSEKKNFDLR
jgi:hypothetical protein